MNPTRVSDCSSPVFSVTHYVFLCRDFWHSGCVKDRLVDCKKETKVKDHINLTFLKNEKSINTLFIDSRDFTNE